MKASPLHLLRSLAGWLAILPLGAIGQPVSNADSLFHMARHQAFDDKGYTAAMATMRSALALSPADPDYIVFLGRLYAWTHRADSARACFSRALHVHPGYADAYVAWTDLESWNGNDSAALRLCDEGLAAHPQFADLSSRRNRLVAALHRHREDALGNRIGLSYDYNYFDRQYSDPWHLLSFQYGHKTGMGPVIGYVNYANRFREGGVQFEAEAYPHLTKTFYGYLDAGYSSTTSLFPRWRGGASLYANLPHALEADAGFRYLDFGSPTLLYTFSLGKYYHNFWFNARCWLVPGQGGTSQSVTLAARYYTGGADDYVSVAMGSGLSPDDNANNVQIAEAYRLKTQKLLGGWRHAFHRHIVFATLQWLYQEYLPDTHGHQWDAGCGYLYTF